MCLTIGVMGSSGGDVKREARTEFGEAYARYAAITPTFVPRLRRATARPA